MDMLRKFIFLGLLVAAGSPVVGQNYNADRVDRPNTKKINIGIKAGFIEKSILRTVKIEKSKKMC